MREGTNGMSDGSGEASSATTVKQPSTQTPTVLVESTGAGVNGCAELMEQAEATVARPDPSMADVIVIGGGPGGYVAAIRAAQLGGKVVLVERDELGGVCLNWGCIPTKAMLSSADAYDLIARRSGELGINVGNVSLDYAKVLDRRDRVVKQLVSGVHFLMKKHNVQVVKGTGKVVSPNSVEVTVADRSKQTISGRNVIIATGSEPVPLPIPGLEGDNVWDSTAALKAAEIPEKLLIIGGGAIGVEWGYMFRVFGSQVTIVELLSQLLPLADSEIAGQLRKTLERRGVRILTDSQVSEVEHKRDGEVAVVACGDSEQRIEADKILMAVGRRPLSAGLGIEELGVATEQGRIAVGDRMQTNVSGLYAIGDVVGGMLLAHKASQEGVVAAENCMGQPSKMDYKSVPTTIYTSPEVAAVGITEDAAKMQELDYRVGKFLFRANGKALGLGEYEGFVKLIADSKYGELLGCHMIGPHVTDLIHEVVLGMEAEATIEEIGRAVHAHPTLSEVVHEAALDAGGESIHKG